MSANGPPTPPSPHRGSGIDLALLAGPTPHPLPVVALSPARQLIVLAVVLGVVLPLPVLATAPSIYSADADPVLAFLGAIITAVITYTAMHLWRPWVAGLCAAMFVGWCVWIDPLGPVSALLIAALLTGAALAVATSRCLSEDHLFVVSAGLPILGVLGLVSLAGLIHGFNPLVRIEAIGRHLIETTLHHLRMSQFPYGPLTHRSQGMINALWEEAPVWIRQMPANAAALMGLALFVLLRQVRRRLRSTAARLTPFWSFRVSEIYIYPVIALCLIQAGAIVWEIPPLQVFSENSLRILLILYWLGGLAVCHCAMLQLRFGLFLRIWCWILLLVVSRYPIAAIGLFDTWFHFRRLTGRLAAPRRPPPG